MKEQALAERLALAVALAAHVAILSMGRHPLAVSPPVSAPSPSSDTSITLDVGIVESRARVPPRSALAAHESRAPPAAIPTSGLRTRGAPPSKPTAPEDRVPDAAENASSGATLRRENQWDEPAPPVDPERAGPFDVGLSGTGLSIVSQIALSDAATAAPTSLPVPVRVTGSDVDRGIGAALRAADAKIGMSNPEEHEVAAAVQLAGRKVHVPSGTRVRVEFDIDANGNMTGARIASASGGDEATWNAMLGDVRGSLSARAIHLGAEAKRAGVRVAVDATILLVFANGTDGKPVIGECPSIPWIGPSAPTRGLFGDAPPSFFAVGGAAFGEEPNGTCLLQDAAGASGSKHIEVRTTSKAFIEGEPPPPLSEFPRPPSKHVSPVQRLIRMLLSQ